MKIYTLATLPDDCIMYILTFLKLPSLYQMKRVDRKFYNITNYFLDYRFRTIDNFFYNNVFYVKAFPTSSILLVKKPNGGGIIERYSDDETSLMNYITECSEKVFNEVSYSLFFF